jgi:hypothetical protein
LSYVFKHRTATLWTMWTRNIKCSNTIPSWW